MAAMPADTAFPACPAVVRDATPADVPALERCYGKADHRDRVRTADGKNLRYLVAEVDGQVVGFGRLALVWHPAVSGAAFFPRMSNLNVREDMRRRGFGTLLIKTMENLTRAAGYPRICVGVQTGNDVALRLYTRLGYQPITGQPAAAPPRPAHVAVLQLAKELSGRPAE